ncbi:glycosyltransferase family 39 protein [Candidatus Roizmanbacteria bacterium]|nr:glycosyltransferase family 39 protein [Candidatus Roizmanbacteria bacterium]
MRKLLSSPEYLFVVGLTVVGAILRFYRLPEMAIFLADEGRDALIIKRIIMLQHFPAIGPPMSTGNIFLGPFYYYFIAPWLLLSAFNPAGLAIGVAFFSTLFIPLFYKIVKKIANNTVAGLAAVFITFATPLITFSRSSWNPNLLPLFSFLSAYFLYQAFKTKKNRYYIAAGAFISFSIQLHYLALFLLPAAAICFLIYFFSPRRTARLRLAGQGILTASSFFIGALPLIIFDVRHNFLNFRNFLKLFAAPGSVASHSPQSFWQSFASFVEYSLRMRLPLPIVIVTFLLLSGFALYFARKFKVGYVMAVFLFSLLIGVSFYPGPKYPHYYASIYPFFYLFLAFFLAGGWSRLTIPVIIAVAVFIGLNTQFYSFFSSTPANQITHAQKVGNFLDGIITEKRFNFAVQPDGWQEDSYLYFLELRGKIPLNREKQEVGDAMYIVCGTPCNPLTSRSWNITMFGKARRVDQWSLDNVTIYKLTHAR